MSATSAPSNLQGQRQPVINCCVHKCKWVRWEKQKEREKEKKKKKTAVRPIFQQGAICERGKWFRGQRTNLLLRKTQRRRRWMRGEVEETGEGDCLRKDSSSNKYEVFYCGSTCIRETSSPPINSGPVVLKSHVLSLTSSCLTSPHTNNHRSDVYFSI